MRTGTLENPISWEGYPDFQAMKCSNAPSCDSKSFAVYVPKDLNKEYESCDDEERNGIMFRRLFSSLSNSGQYYYCARVTCAKCGQYLDGPVLFMPLDDWKPPKDPSTEGRSQ
jgi:hypothetical protein